MIHNKSVRRYNQETSLSKTNSTIYSTSSSINTIDERVSGNDFSHSSLTLVKAYYAQRKSVRDTSPSENN